MFMQSKTIHQLRESLAGNTKFLCGTRAVATRSHQRGTNELRVERSSRCIKTRRLLQFDAVEVRRER